MKFAGRLAGMAAFDLSEDLSDLGAVEVELEGDTSPGAGEGLSRARRTEHLLVSMRACRREDDRRIASRTRGAGEKASGAFSHLGIAKTDI